MTCSGTASISAGIAPSTTLITGSRFATTSAGCIIANAGTSSVSLSIAPARVIGGDIIPPNNFTLAPTSGGAIAVVTTPGQVYCHATVTSGNAAAARLTLCTDGSGISAPCTNYADAR